MKNDNTKVMVKSIIEFVILAVCIYILFTYVVMPIRISGSSMSNYLEDGNIAFINSIGVKINGVDRFDVVVLYSDTLNEKIIKRVIGLPGDHIEYKNDKLYINNKYYKQDFLDQDFINDSLEKYDVDKFTNDFEVDVKDNQIFVLGDNRLRSTDSRELGCFSYDDIIGKKGVVLYPFSDMKMID